MAAPNNVLKKTLSNGTSVAANNDLMLITLPDKQPEGSSPD
jgi:hypothetical protein